MSYVVQEFSTAQVRAFNPDVESTDEAIGAYLNNRASDGLALVSLAATSGGRYVFVFKTAREKSKAAE
jgi:hypothetical protein